MSGPMISNNLYYDTVGTLPYSASPADTNPTVGNPGFVNAAQNNYNFTSGPPAITGGSFTAISVATVGPLPNNGPSTSGGEVQTPGAPTNVVVTVLS